MIATLLSRFAVTPNGKVLCDPSGLQCQSGLPQVSANSSQFHTALQIVFGIMAAVAVLMIVIAGFRFVTAQGNPQETAKARNTIVYAVIGLAVALVAEAIVSLVLSRLQ